MNQRLKVILAKEVIIVFITVVLIGLCYPGIWIYNQYKIQKIDKLKGMVNIWNENLAVQKAEIPKTDNFYEIIECDFVSMFENPIYRFNGLDLPKKRAYQLYDVLIALKYPIKEKTLDEFANNVIQEYSLPEREREQQDEIFSFLNDHNCLRVDFKEFSTYLNGGHIQRFEIFELLYYNDIEQRDKLIQERINNANSLLVGEKYDQAYKFLALLIITIIYPLRFLIIGVIWAIKTIRKN